jgi:PRD1 phage membrane DNA delivery
MNNMFEPVVTIAAGIIGVAIIAVLVSKNAQTSNVLGAAGSAFANALSAATGPVTGQATAANVNGPTSSGSYSTVQMAQVPTLSLNG